MNKPLKKAICVFVISFVLIVSAVLFAVDYSQIRFGVGSGKNVRIESIDEVSDLLTLCLHDLMIDDSHNLPVSGQQEFRSVTLHSSSNGALSSEIFNFNIGSTERHNYENIDFERNSTVYITENATLISSDIRFSDSFEYKQGINDKTVLQSKHYISLKVQLYLGDDAAMFRFDRYIVIVDGQSYMNLNSVLGEWVRLEDYENAEYNTFLSQTTDFLKASFDVIPLIAQSCQSENYVLGKGSAYQISESLIDGFMVNLLLTYFSRATYDYSYYDSTKQSAKLEVNLKDSTKPEIRAEFKGDLSFNKIEIGEMIKIDYNSAIYDQLIFSNINNTVINPPSFKGALSPEEFMRLTEKTYESQ